MVWLLEPEELLLLLLDDPLASGALGCVVSFVSVTLPDPLAEPLPLAEPRTFTPPSFVEMVAEDELLPLSTVASEPVPPCSLHPASANAAANIVSCFFIRLESAAPVGNRAHNVERHGKPNN